MPLCLISKERYVLSMEGFDFSLSSMSCTCVSCLDVKERNLVNSFVLKISVVPWNASQCLVLGQVLS